jgi:hypothetical protein
LANTILSESAPVGERFAPGDDLLSRPDVLASPVNLGPPIASPADQVADQAAWFRSWETDLGYLIAAHIDALAAEMRSLGGRTVLEFIDRREAMVTWAAEREEVA